MEIVEITERERLGLRRLGRRGIIEVLQDPKSEEYVLAMSKGVSKGWVQSHSFAGMTQIRCSKEELLGAVQDFLVNKILAD
jgi:hypothetical protein